MTFKTTSKWVSYERQAHLVRLFVNYPDNCLLGHYLCTNPEHYLDTTLKTYTVARAIEQQCFDTDGTPQKDKDGNFIYLSTYTSYQLLRLKEGLHAYTINFQILVFRIGRKMTDKRT